MTFDSKNTKEITRKFTIENVNRMVDNFDDIHTLRDWTKRLWKLYLKERDHSIYLANSLKIIENIKINTVFLLGIGTGISISGLIYILLILL